MTKYFVFVPVYHDVRLHYGGDFAKNNSIEGVELYDWKGGAYVDVQQVTLDTQTLEGISKLFTTYCPLNQSMNLRFFYMAGGCRYELDKDMEVEFAWSMCSANTVGAVRNLFCVSDLMIENPNPSVILSDNVVLDEVVDHVDALPNVSPIRGVVSPRRSVRLASLNELPFDSPASNTRGASQRQTPNKTVAKQRTAKVWKAKVQIEQEEAPVRTSMYINSMYA